MAASRSQGTRAQEGCLRSVEQDARAEHAADDAGDEERREKAARVGSEGAAIGDGAGDGAGPDRGGVGGVGGDGRHAGEEQRGEGDEAAASSDGIEDSCDECGGEEENGMRDGHTRE